MRENCAACCAGVGPMLQAGEASQFPCCDRERQWGRRGVLRMTCRTREILPCAEEEPVFKKPDVVKGHTWVHAILRKRRAKGKSSSDQWARKVTRKRREPKTKRRLCGLGLERENLCFCSLVHWNSSTVRCKSQLTITWPEKAPAACLHRFQLDYDD